MSIISNPFLKNKYKDLREATDSISKKIVSNLNTIYDQAIIFNSATDIQILDSTILDIQNKYVEIINFIRPCASVSNIDKCNTPICNTPKNLAINIETIYAELIAFFHSLPGYTNPSNSSYRFLTDLIIFDFTNIITSNPSNRDIYNPIPTYYLCSGSSYVPSGLSPSHSGKYAEILARAVVAQKATVARHGSNTSINFLLYILLPTVIFIVLVLLYIRHVRQAAINDEDMMFALQSIKDSKDKN